jgi:type II secretory pathway predicted ATPase ExeA
VKRSLSEALLKRVIAMYTEFFDLKEKPFDLTPSPRFVHLSEGHREALALLRYGVTDRKGFILLTGEVGTGKTTMVRTLLDSLNHSVKYVLLSNPILSPQDFTKYLALSIFKKSINFNSKAHFLLVFEPYLKRAFNNNQNFNLIIDEAHKLSFALLEEIRLLSNMETGDHKLINIFLVGQPELNEKLSDPRCRPLLQRISIRYHIPPLNLKESRDYMNTRLKVAGEKKNNHIFPKAAMDAIHHFSSGYPREINILADNALLLGYSKGVKKITPSMVKACYEDLKLDVASAKPNIQEAKKRRNRETEMQKRGNEGIETEKRRDGETEKVEKEIETATKEVENSRLVHFWKWAAVFCFLLALSLAAANPRGKRIISHLYADLISIYDVAMDKIPTEQLSAQSQVSMEAPVLPDNNSDTSQLKPSGRIEGEFLQEPVDKSSTTIITKKKVKSLRYRNVPLVRLKMKK